MLVHASCLEVGHRVVHSGLGSRLCSLLLHLIQLVQVFLSGRIQLGGDSLLSVEGSGL